ncbi:MAG: TIGR04372 family glycosyltransferase [Rhodospirillaceae bacterium]|nr:TIGR04372 family glycosyltransferase [Rhodospirillaceae bacterium]
MKILAQINARSFGDFASSLFFLNSVADCFDHKIVTLLYRDDMAFKSKLVKLANIHNEFRVPRGEMLPSFELINCSSPVPQEHIKGWFEANLQEQHLIVSETMSAAFNLALLDRFAYLTFPADIAQACETQLLELGLSKDSWFCAMHCREPGFDEKPTVVNFRDGDPAIFRIGVEHVLDKLGGQVVRLGHPGMTPYPARKGYVDLSAMPDSSMLQAYAISRARFMFSGPSGPAAVAEAFDVPLALMDMVDHCLFKDRDVARTINVVTASGQTINQQRYVDMDLNKLVLKELAMRGCKLYKNGAPELIALIDRIADVSSDTQGWREPTPLSSAPRPNSFTFPRPGRHKCTFI